MKGVTPRLHFIFKFLLIGVESLNISKKFFTFAHIIWDTLSALAYALLSLMIIWPFDILLRPFIFNHIFLYLRTLVPLGYLSNALKISIYLRLGRYELAISSLEKLTRKLEVAYMVKPQNHLLRNTLGYYYSNLAKTYLSLGHVDRAMTLVIRGQRYLGRNCLPGIIEIDVKTAHCIRTALIAGKIIEHTKSNMPYKKPTPNGHTATPPPAFRPVGNPKVSASKQGKVFDIRALFAKNTPQERAGATVTNKRRSKKDIARQKPAKVIPFSHPPTR